MSIRSRALLDQGRRYAVAVTDTHQARVFVVALGAIRERTAVENAKLSRSAAGGWSQRSWRRRAASVCCCGTDCTGG